MKHVKKNIKIDKKFKEEFLSELWQNATFDDYTFSLLEDIINHQKQQKHPTAITTETLVNQKTSYALSTVRNRNLITQAQQEKLLQTVVGFFGLSVGSHAAINWMIESRANTIKIADHDFVSPSNLNRLRYGWEEVGRQKVELVQQELLHINPFASVLSLQNTNIVTMQNFLQQSPKIDILVDAIDDMEGKILLRKFAKSQKIPLISAADVGDMVMLDVERHDHNPQPAMFLGRLPDIEKINFENLSDIERKKLIIKLVGFEKNSEDMLDSLLALGKTLLTWPQLGATAAIAGGVAATTIKKIVLGEDIQSGRYYISLDEILVGDFNNEERKRNRKKKIEALQQKFSLNE